MDHLAEVKEATRQPAEIMLRSLAICPATGQLTRWVAGQTVIIPDGLATWWRCTACGGWHTTLSEPEQ